MIRLTANTRRAKATSDDAITTGSVGIPVTLSLSDDFDGLSSTVRFKSGTDTADVPVLGEQITVPPQCLQTANAHLYVGVYALDGNGNVVIPTVWADAGIVRRGVTPYDADPTDPTPGWGAQVQQWAMDAHDTAERLAAEVDGWETGENARIAAESARASAERSRVNAEAVRVSNESSRISAESSRATAETARSSAEAARVTAEQARASAETSRNSAETDRGRNESARISAESARATAESSRVTAERQRVLAEQSRVSAESARATAEQNRANAESARATAEQARSSAESVRASAETSRANEWTALKADAVSATSAANTAASSANTAASDIRAAATRGDFDGYSPTVSISSTDSAHTVTITDKAGDHSYTVPTYAEEEAARAYAWGELSAEATEAIEAAQEAAAEVKPQVAQLFGNQLTGILSGTIATADDAYAAPPMALSVDGNSTQASTTGKNLLDPDLTHWSTYNLPSIGSRKGFLIPVTEGTYNYHNLTTIDMKYGWVDDASDVAGTYTDGADITAHLTAGTQIAADGTHPFILMSTWTGTAQALMYEREPMLERGTANTGYEPYTGGKASPNPDYPQPILSVDDLSLVLAGKNLLDYNGADSQTINGVTVPDLLPEGTNLRSLPDGTRDTLSLSYLRPSTRAGWAWYEAKLVQRVANLTLTSSATISAYTYSGHHGVAFSNVLSNRCTRVSNYCTHAKGTSKIWVGANDANVYLITILDDLGISSVAEFRTWLTNNPITVDYLLATPVTTLDTIELPQLPAPNCTVWCDGGSSTPTYQMQYVQDTNIVIAELRAALADLATS